MSRTRLDRAAWMVCVVVLGLTSATQAIDPDPSGFNKPRFISFNPNQQEALTSIRIWMVSLHHVEPPYNRGPTIPFTLFEGESIWVGPPSTYIEGSAQPGNTFKASYTQCAPHYHDWSTVGLVHVTGAHIVPSSIYEVEQLSGACQGQEDICEAVSPRLQIHTTRWGDVEALYNPPSTTAQPDVADIAAGVAKFRSLPGASTKVRVLLAGQNDFGVISVPTLTTDFNFGHMAACVDAFRGNGYPYKMGKCSGSPYSVYYKGTCTVEADCTGPNANGAGPCIPDSVGTCTGPPTGSATGACRWDSDCVGANGDGPCILPCPN